MDKNAIKKYAVWARRELISRVSQKAYQYGIRENEIIDANADSIDGKLLTASEKKERQALIRQIQHKGFEQVMEEVAYTWFNRFSALRFMEVNGYLPTHVRVFTDEENNFKPQIITEAIHLELDGLDMDKVYTYVEADNKDELFKYLLITQCNALNKILPGMFQKIADYTELLFPDNLLREGSVIEQMIALIPEVDWKDAVQIIGWLYQYYNIDPKANVDAKVKQGIRVSKQELPAKTQIFTPDWVVRYMVENSLGRLWLEGHPDEELKAKWNYYLDEAEQEADIQVQLAKVREEYKIIKPVDIRVIDPCMGSGHILVYAFDVLIQIYEAYGYNRRDAVKNIVENNLFGLDIDERAAQMAYFAVMMKARQYDRRFFSRQAQPRVYEIRESNHLDQFCVEYFINDNDKLKADMQILIDKMRDAKEYGALINISAVDFDAIFSRFDEINDEFNIAKEFVLYELKPFIEVARILSMKYETVITNPPYLGGGGMSEKLAEYAKCNYPESKNDMFAAFIERGNLFAKIASFNCMVTMQSWMFLSSYEKMRKKLLKTCTIVDLMHMDNQVMGIAFGTAVTVFRTMHMPQYRGTYNFIYNRDIENDVPREFPVMQNRFAQVASTFYQDIPGSPIAYWISLVTRNSFLSKDTIGTLAPPKQGLATANNDRFLRLWFEVNLDKIGFGMSSCESALLSNKKWFPYNKGGAFRRWYGNRDYVVNWENDGYEIKSFRDENGKVRSRPQNLQYYFKPAITWSDVTSGSFSGRYVENGFMFDVKGSSGFPQPNLLNYILGLLNSKVAQAFIKILNPTMTTQVGDMTRIPVIENEEYVKKINLLVEECIRLSQDDWNSFETSWEFKKHPLICECKLISEAFQKWSEECNLRFKTIKKNEEEINRIFISIYGLENELDPYVDSNYITIHTADKKREIESLISYAVGCMFGRYSLDVSGLNYYNGNWNALCSGKFVSDEDNIIPICDDEYFQDDIVGRFVKVIETIYGADTLEENLKFIANALSGKGTVREVIRTYFLDDFYTAHCSNYSVTGSGKRPIYWLFDSGKKNGFKALIYMHRYQPDTIARMRTDYVHEQQERYRTAIAHLEQRISEASTSERVKLNKQLVKLQDQAAEIRVYEEKIHHLADQMIRIDLDNGVKQNYELFKDVLAKIK